MSGPGEATVGELAGLHYRFDPAPDGAGSAGAGGPGVGVGVGAGAAGEAPGAGALPGAGWTLLLLHGTGGNEAQLGGLGRELLPGAAQLSPRGHILEGGAPRFFARSGLNVFNPADVNAGVDGLIAFIKAAAAEHQLDLAKTVAVGYSNGANAALVALQNSPGLFRGAVLLRGMLVLEPPPGEPLAGVDLLALGGGRDPLVDTAGYAHLLEATRAAGAAVTAHVEPNAGHDLAQSDFAAAREWLTALTAAG